MSSSASASQELTISGEHGDHLLLPVTPELSETLDLCALINHEVSERFAYSFRGLMLALAFTPHGISRWLRRTAESSGALRANVISTLSSTRLEQLAEEAIKSAPRPWLYPDGRRMATASTLSWLGAAQRASGDQGHARVGLRHVVGSLIFNQEFHEEELRSWGFRRPEWAKAFVDYMREEHPKDAAYWQQRDAREFGEQRAIETAAARGPAYMLGWDAKALPFSRFETTARLLEVEREVVLPWSSEPREAVTIGARVFLHRDDQAAPGIVGFGTVVGPLRNELNGEPALSSRADALMLPVRWRILREIPVLPVALLKERLKDDVALLAASEIPAELADRLEALCQNALVPARFEPSTAFSASLPGIVNDGVDGQPFIKIAADVQAIARVMCMKEVKPPLSIALFGNWGSGKSFFMRQLQQEVRRTRRSDETQFYREIVQIEFNAWHYVEANLWSSLVFHVFDQLRASKLEGKQAKAKQEAEREHDQLLNQLGVVGQARAIAQKELEQATLTVQQLEQALIIKQNDAQSKQLELQRIKTTDILEQAVLSPDVVTQLKEAARVLGLSAVGDSTRELERSLRDLQQFGSEAGSFLRAFWAAPGRAQRLLFVALAVISPFVVSGLISLLPTLFGTSAWSAAKTLLAQVGSAILLLVEPISRAASYGDTALKAIRRAEYEFQVLRTKGEDERKQEMHKVEAARKAAQDAVAAADAKLREAELAVQKARQALLDISPVYLLNSFIEERSASDDYRKNLGTLAIVRRDFQKLSDLMGAARDSRAGKKALQAEEKKLLESLPKLDRIILYIDDLDRCPPKQVVEVLQAIHLLLAFDLFVVVVGVDPRWISLSLQKHYPELLGQGDAPDDDDLTGPAELGRARPIDYLEKIFQIPFWLKPTGPTELTAMVEGLLSTDLAGPPASARQGAAQVADEKRVPLHSPSTPEASQPGKTTVDEDQEERAGFVSTKLNSDEARFIASLGPAIGATPRAIKRFVNVYRLLRARVSKARAQEFEGEAGQPRQFEAVVHLLAMFSTAPRLAQAFCRELEQGKAHDQTLPDVLERLRGSQVHSVSESQIFDALEKYVQSFDVAPSVADYLRWFPVVSRYCFAGEALSRPAEPAPVKVADSAPPSPAPPG